MPDITMCRGEGCPLRDNCYRYTAEPNPFRQSYFLITPEVINGECDCQLPIKKSVNKTKDAP